MNEPIDELSPLSLLLLCDLAACDGGRRRGDRVGTLFGVRSHTNGGTTVPAAVRALADASLVEIRRSARHNAQTEPGWTVEITDKGLAAHRQLMTALRAMNPL